MLPCSFGSGSHTNQYVVPAVTATVFVSVAPCQLLTGLTVHEPRPSATPGWLLTLSSVHSPTVLLPTASPVKSSMLVAVKLDGITNWNASHGPPTSELSSNTGPSYAA